LGVKHQCLQPYRCFSGSIFYPSTSCRATAFYRSTWGAAAPHGGSYGYTISDQAMGALDSDYITTNISPNTQYNLYAYVRGEVDADDSAHNYQVRIMFYDSNSSYLGYQDAYGGAPDTINMNWQLKGGQVTTPANTCKVRVELRVQMITGWVAFDDVSLIKVAPPPSWW